MQFRAAHSLAVPVQRGTTHIILEPGVQASWHIGQVWASNHPALRGSGHPAPCPIGPRWWGELSFTPAGMKGWSHAHRATLPGNGNLHTLLGMGWRVQETRSDRNREGRQPPRTDAPLERRDDARQVSRPRFSGVLTPGPGEGCDALAQSGGVGLA